MADVKDRLAPLEGLEAPDLWDQVRRHHPAPPPSEPPGGEHRIAVISIALALAIAAVGFLVIAFRQDLQVTPVTPGPSRVQNGDIWVKVGGGESGTAIVRVDPERVDDSEWQWADGRATFGDAIVAPELVADDYSFSPDGTRVVFSSQSTRGAGDVARELFVMNADGTGRRQLTNDGFHAGFPAWSPDGTSIAYASYRGNDYIPGCLGFSICPTDLYLVAATGGTPSALVATAASETTPTWSPDGSRIAYAEITGVDSGAIVTVLTDGSDRVELGHGRDVTFPSWSPDGNSILFLQARGGTNHVWTVAPDGSGLHDVVDTRTDTNFGRPVWAPTGDAIAFARPYAGTTALWIVDPSGDLPPERIAGWPGFDGAPIAWRPETVSGEVSLLVSSSGPSGDQALLTGTLTTESGCVAVATGPASSVYVVWPKGYSLADEDGATWLIDDSGSRVAKMGDQVQMGGGITNLTHAATSVQGGIPTSCQAGGPDAYWFAGTPEVADAPPPDSEATRLPEIDAYKVCRVLSLHGDFGEEGDEVVVFEEERVPGAGCVGEGFQHIAVLRDGRVTALSRRITDLAGDAAWKVWPYATPDLNGDGTDEIVLANTYVDGKPHVWFFMLSPGGGGIEPIYNPGAVDDPDRSFSHTIGAGSDSTSRPRGVYCEGAGDARLIVTWEANPDDPLEVAETRWRLLPFEVEFVSDSTVVVDGEAGAYPNSGDEELCGSPVSPRNAYP